MYSDPVLPQRFLYRIAHAISMLLVPTSTLAMTTVGALITADTHWQPGGSPYIASSSLLVDIGAVLTIDPGVEVRFAQTTGLVVVNGTLSARGTEWPWIPVKSQQSFV